MVIVSSVLIGGGCDDVNHPPELLPLNELLAPVNQSVELTIFGRDVDGDPLSFSFTFDPPPQVYTEGALGQPTLTPLSTTQALFQWAPSIADVGTYSLTITTTDPQGLSDSETIRLEVFSATIGDQSMRFTHPVGAGQSLNLMNQPCLELPLMVTADGIPAEEVLIDLPNLQIEGTTLDPPGELTGKERLFRWCPSASQIAEADRYTFTFRARRRLEGTSNSWSEGIRKRYLVRLEDSSPLDTRDCVGRPPTLMHLAPMEVSGLDDYLVELSVYDDLGIKSPPLLAVWPESSSPATTLNDPQWLLSELAPDAISTELWRGVIPNLNLAEGERSTLYYGFIVTDNDDPMGARCDHTIESPVYELNVVGGANGGGRLVCAPCAHDAQCGQEADLCLVYPEGSFCGRFCSLEQPCDPNQECVELTSPEGQTFNQCVPNNLTCVTQCVPDEFDRVSTPSADSAPLISTGRYSGLSICDDAIDVYQLEIPPQSGVEVSISFDTTALDFDLFLALGGEVNSDGQLVFQYESASPNRSPERIKIGCANPNETSERAWIVVAPYDESDRGSYQLDLSFSSEDCLNACQDDELESLGAAPIMDGYYQGLQLCAGDEDLFVFDVEAGWVISALLSFNAEDGDLNVALYGANREVIARDEGVRSGALIEWRAEQTGTYALEVKGATMLSQNQYSLDLYLFPTEPCTETLTCAPETFCYTQLGCLEYLCTPTLGCGADHLCVYPLASTSDEGRCGAICNTDSECRLHERCKPVSLEESACVEAGVRQVGESCSRHEDCAGGLICIDEGSRGACR